jgi:serine/threonine protein kinase
VTEIKIHKSLEHKNVIGFDHVFEDSENVYIILELCHNNTLNEMMKRRKRICESEVQYYIYHVIQGLIYLHQQKVIHRE